MFCLVMATMIFSGCESGGTDEPKSSCVKNPSICVAGETVAITGKVLVPSTLNLSSSRPGLLKRLAALFGAEKILALTSTQPLPGATVWAGYLDKNGEFKAFSSAYSITDSQGSFTIYGVTPADNIVLAASYTTPSATINVDNIVSIDDSYKGGSFPAQSSTVETTLAVKAVKNIIDNYNVVSSTDITSEDIDSTKVADILSHINDNLQSQVTKGNVSLANILTSPGTLQSELDKLSAKVTELKVLVSQMSAPAASSAYAVAFIPANGETGVAYDGASFSIVFSKRMDSTITPQGFSISIQKASNGVSFAISDLNWDKYGYFTWSNSLSSSSASRDKLTFTLYSNSVLNGKGLSTLDANSTYKITSFIIPSNLKDFEGSPLNTLKGIPSLSGGSYGTFTTRP